MHCWHSDIKMVTHVMLILMSTVWAKQWTQLWAGLAYLCEPFCALTYLICVAQCLSRCFAFSGKTPARPDSVEARGATCLKAWTTDECQVFGTAVFIPVQLCAGLWILVLWKPWEASEKDFYKRNLIKRKHYPGKTLLTFLFVLKS